MTKILSEQNRFIFLELDSIMNEDGKESIQFSIDEKKCIVNTKTAENFAEKLLELCKKVNENNDMEIHDPKY